MKITLSPAMKDLIALIKEIGLPYEIVPTKKHIRIFIAGRCAAVVSRGARPEQGMRGMRNIVGSIRRVAREAIAAGHTPHSDGSPDALRQ